MDLRQKLTERYQRLTAFIRFVIINFIHDDCAYRASALAFTTLLAIVPLMTVGLAIFSSFPVFQGLAQPLQDFIFQNFVPATGKIIQGYLQLFTTQVSKLPMWGIAFLFVTALLMMFTIEQAMNKIWHVRSSRQGVAAFLLFWAILSLAPIFLGLSLAASSYLISLPFIQEHQTPSLVLNMTPYLLSLLGFTFLYVVVPNHPVKLSHGLAGGLFASTLFEAAKLGFAYYLTRYNMYALLYGAFAAIPLFFIWVYLVWIITLLGAEISYALSVHYQRRIGKRLQGFVHALLWLHGLWIAQKKGMGLTTEELVDASTHPFVITVDEMLKILMSVDLIHQSADGQYRLSRDMNQTNLYHLAQHMPFRLPAPDDLLTLQPALANSWKKVFNQYDAKLKESLGMTLEQLFRMVDQSEIT